MAFGLPSTALGGTRSPLTFVVGPPFAFECISYSTLVELAKGNEFVTPAESNNGAWPSAPTKTLHVKVGGVMHAEDAALAGSLGAWAVGVHFAPKDPRFVPAARAKEILQAVPAGVLKTGLFRNQSPEVVRRVADEVGLDLVELAGHESDEEVKAIGPERVLKTVVIHEVIGVGTVLGYSAAYLQLNKAHLGTEQLPDSVDVRIAAELAARFPRTLIGGPLEPQDVAETWNAARPWGLDASRGVDPVDGDKSGRKDPERMRAFFAAVEAAVAS